MMDVVMRLANVHEVIVACPNRDVQCQEWARVCKLRQEVAITTGGANGVRQVVRWADGRVERIRFIVIGRNDVDMVRGNRSLRAHAWYGAHGWVGSPELVRLLNDACYRR